MIKKRTLSQASFKHIPFHYLFGEFVLLFKNDFPSVMFDNQRHIPQDYNHKGYTREIANPSLS
jgi:hypothetical protein